MKKTKILITLLIMSLVLLYSTITQAKMVNIGETKYLERGEQGFYSIQYWNDYYQNWYYITYSRTFFTDNNGNERIAYCCSPDDNGIGWIPGEYEGYDTTIQYQLSNDDDTQKRLWRIFKNGYPYVSPEQLGVETEDDAYLATKQAAYFIIRDRGEDEVYDYFRPGEDYVEGQDQEETYRRGEKVIEAIYNLVYIGNNGEEEINNVTIKKNGDIQKDGENSYQEYEIISNNSEEKVEIKSIENCPNNTIITDEEGNETYTFYGGEKFKVLFKNKEVMKDYDIKIKYISSCRNYPVFYAQSTIEDTQDYLLTVDSLDDEEGCIHLAINSKQCKLQLKKVDEKTKQPLSGVKFKIEYKDGEKIGEYVTDKNGLIELENLKPEKIVLSELEALDGYIINSNQKEYQLCFNETTKVEINNKEKEIEKCFEDKKETIVKKLPRTGY